MYFFLFFIFLLQHLNIFFFSNAATSTNEVIPFPWLRRTTATSRPAGSPSRRFHRIRLVGTLPVVPTSGHEGHRGGIHHGCCFHLLLGLQPARMTITTASSYLLQAETSVRTPFCPPEPPNPRCCHCCFGLWDVPPWKRAPSSLSLSAISLSPLPFLPFHLSRCSLSLSPLSVCLVLMRQKCHCFLFFFLIFTK